MTPEHDGCGRFIAKHPAMKVVRTPVALASAAVVRNLFPDVGNRMTWTVHLKPADADDQVTGCFFFVFE